MSEKITPDVGTIEILSFHPDLSNKRLIVYSDSSLSYSKRRITKRGHQGIITEESGVFVFFEKTYIKVALKKNMKLTVNTDKLMHNLFSF